MDIVDPEVPRFGNVLLYGPPKTGKTTGAATAPGLVLYLNADLPNATMFAHRRDTEKRLKEARWGGQAMLSEVMHMVDSQDPVNPTVDSVVLDTYGEAYRRLLLERSGGARRPTLAQRGDVGTDLERFAYFMCEAPCNFIMVAHELAEKDEDTGGFERIAFTGAKSSSPGQSNKLMGMVDIVGYTGVVDVEGEGKKFMAQLTIEKGRTGGDRFDCLGDYREVNLTEWFTEAGVHTGTPQEAEKKTTARSKK